MSVLSTMYDVQCTAYNVRRTVYYVQCTAYNVRRKMYATYVVTLEYSSSGRSSCKLR